ncbi:MAG TPA: peptidylprolyl isomerase [Burkholderiaceae bacterium]|nr:peptidylprolyl isomerase [Burkholderiaceae bacterium]
MRTRISALLSALFALSIGAVVPAHAQQFATPAAQQSFTPNLQQAAPAAAPVATPAAGAPPGRGSTPVDRIIAVVNEDVITASELRARTQAAMFQLQRQKIQAPPADVLQRQVLERMIVDKAQLQLARETGVRVDDATVNMAITRIAEANNMSLQSLRQKLETDGISFNQFREDVRQDILINRVREREVDGRLQISESELDNFIAAQAGVASDTEEINLAQILLRVPENATAQRIDETLQRANDLVTQLKGGTDFARLAASYSNASEALQGGALGWRAIDRLPTLFVDAVKGVKVGDIAPVVRSPNGFHILKVLGRRSAVEGKLAGGPVQQTHARHILLKVSDIAPEPEVKRRLEEFKARVEHGQVEFGTLARLHSVDPSGSRGGDLGWLYPGDTVPEFERAMDALKINEISGPVQSPFGWHLIQVIERRTEPASTERARQQARQALRERKADEAYQDWLRQLRDKTYVEYRFEDRG